MGYCQLLNFRRGDVLGGEENCPGKYVRGGLSQGASATNARFPSLRPHVSSARDAAHLTFVGGVIT